MDGPAPNATVPTGGFVGPRCEIRDAHNSRIPAAPSSKAHPAATHRAEAPSTLSIHEAIVAITFGSTWPCS
jgi:hypothetical protein